MISRRGLLVSAAGGAATLALTRFSMAGVTFDMTLPKLPYAYDALEPYIDAQTMMIHHDKHHQGYVDKLNAALKSAAPDWLDKPVEEVVANYKKLPESIQTAVRNNGGGHLNHSLFWTMMAPAGKGACPAIHSTGRSRRRLATWTVSRKSLPPRQPGNSAAVGAGW